jgi:molybdate transport system regulatory protein
MRTACRIDCGSRTTYHWRSNRIGTRTCMAFKHDVQIRLLVETDIAMGPGKADLLAAIQETGSISAAGRRLGMSYKRAWLLVETMNQCFQSPLVAANKGGTGGGGAVVTALGEQILAEYRLLQDEIDRVVEARLPYFARLIRAAN